MIKPRLPEKLRGFEGEPSASGVIDSPARERLSSLGNEYTRSKMSLGRKKLNFISSDLRYGANPWSRVNEMGDPSVGRTWRDKEVTLRNDEKRSSGNSLGLSMTNVRA